MKTVFVAAIMVACLALAVGCAPADQTEDNAALNRAYISTANTTMMQVNADLEPFTAAVAAEDVVTMEQAAANVYRDLDQFKAITAPKDMKDIHAEYSAGCDDLKKALQDYVALYKDAANTDVNDLNGTLAEIQKTYDSGIAHLQAADKMVTSLPGALPEASSSSSAEAGSASETASASGSEG
jgi:paraquat-inducible protein B